MTYRREGSYDIGTSGARRNIVEKRNNGQTEWTMGGVIEQWAV